MKKLVLTSIILIFFGNMSLVNAQESITVSGGNATGENGSLSYSVGQVFYSESMGGNGSIAEGLQQAYEIYVLPNVKEILASSFGIEAYPNPAMDYISLIFEKYPSISLQFQLFDMQGNILLGSKVANQETHIDMQGLPSGTYLLVVYEGELIIRNFKIIKTQ